MSEILVLAGVAAHIGIIIWAIANRHPWGAVGIFLFPVLGDIVYIIWYSATKEPWYPQVGDRVASRRRVKAPELDLPIPSATEFVVQGVAPDGRIRVTRPSASSNHYDYLKKDLRFVRRDKDDLRFVTRDESEPPRAPTLEPPAGVSDPNSYGEIRELAALKEEGLITEEEFNAKKRQILGL